MPQEDAQDLAEALIAELHWTAPWYLVSAVSREGTWPIMKSAMTLFEHQREVAAEQSVSSR